MLGGTSVLAQVPQGPWSEFYQVSHEQAINRQQRLQALETYVKQHPEHSNAARVTTEIQILGSIIEAALRPAFQSFTDGAEVLLGHMIGGMEDSLTVRYSQGLVDSMRKLHSTLSNTAFHSNNEFLRFNSVLQRLGDHVNNSPHKRSDEHQGDIHPIVFSIKDVLTSGATLAKQNQDALNKQLKEHPGSPTRAYLRMFIAGTDAQIDNIAGYLFSAIEQIPVVGTALKPTFDFLLGPFFQSLTDGAEVLIAKFAGGIVDNTVVAAARGLYNDMQTLQQRAIKISPDNAKKLDKGISVLKDHLSKT